MGRQHALNTLHYVPQTTLLCVCSPAQADLEWADEHLVPYGVHAYKSVEEMLQEPGLEAVIIASTTKLHLEHILASIDRGLHILCEKPLSMSAAETRSVVEEARKPKNKHLKIMTAYSRRFDPSYQNALRAIESGRIGSPVAIRSETRDKFDRSDFYMRYIMANPGIFIDTLIHDVDLTLSFLGADARPRSATAIGTISLHPELERIQDVDNGMGIVEWYPSS